MKQGMQLKGKRGVTGMMAALTGAGVALTAVAQEKIDRVEFEVLQQEVAGLKARLEQEPQGARAVTPVQWPDGLEFGALLEVESFYQRRAGKSDNDITLATVELSAGWQANNWIRGDLVFLYEEDDTEPMEVDQAFVTLGNTDDFPLFVQVGKRYVPFGNLESFFVSDPVVLELAETRETAAVLGVEHGGFAAMLSAFNGEVETGRSGMDNFTASVSWQAGTEERSLRMGAGWIRNLMDSDGLTGVLEDPAGFNYVNTAPDTSGMNLWAVLDYGPLTLIAEYVKTLKTMEVDGATTGLKPEALNLELGGALSEKWEAAVKYEQARDVEDWFARRRYGAVVRRQLRETEWVHASAALEYLREDFGAGADDADVITLQVALEF